MAINLTYNARIENGQLKMNRKRLKDDIRHLDDVAVTLTIQKRKKQRSNPQNAFYWSVVVPAIEYGFNEVGMRTNRKEVHDFIKANFNTKTIVNESTGEGVTIPRSTTELSTFEFAEMIEAIQQWAAEFLGIIIPDPNEQSSLNFE